MKQKFYVLIAAFLMLTFYSMSQYSSDKEAKPYFGQTGIKKKIWELKAVKPVARKNHESTYFNLLKFRLKEFSNFTKPDKESRIAGVVETQREEDIKTALRATSSVSSTPTQQVWSNFLSFDYLEDPFPYRIPPDISGAVSAAQVIVSTRFGIKVYDKPAVTDLPVVTPAGYSREMAHPSLFLAADQFFSPVLPEGSFIDFTHMRYDRLSKRWFVIAIEVSQKIENNLVLIAVSNGDKITDSSSFTYYSFNSALLPYDHSAPQGPLLLFPTLGIDKHAVLIGGTQYGYGFRSFVAYVIDKEKLIKGNLAVYPFELGRVNDAPHFITEHLHHKAYITMTPLLKKAFLSV